MVIDRFMEENDLSSSPKKEIRPPNTVGPQEIWNSPSP